VSEGRGFKSFERISRYRLLSREFSPGEELTLTMKMRRNVIAERNASLIEEMYC
jgi:long-chain acyl-CoA synthetase